MKFKIQLIVDDEGGQTQIEDILQLDKDSEYGHTAGLSLQESKQLLKRLQKNIVLYQAKSYTHSHRKCTSCHRNRRIKDERSIQYRTLFGTVVIPNLRLYHCPCEHASARTFSILDPWLPEHCSPELQYIETKWASHMSFSKTSTLLQDVLPVSLTHNKVTVRNHLHKVAKRQEAELEKKPFCISGCANDWAKLPKPGKPLVVGIDGGYVRSCKDRKSNFEVIVGKSFSKNKPAKRFGLVQCMDKRPQRRLLHVLREQGMQENQQITFLSDGADNVRELQYLMHPESEHILDWFHLTMRLTVLNQCAKGLSHSDAEEGKEFSTKLESAKWYLWHGNVEKAQDCLEDCYCIAVNEDIDYKGQKNLIKYLEELETYIDNNRHLIPNYGERWRYGEAISSSFVESTVNEVVTKRMVKKQQMQWSEQGAHYLLQTRTATLNGDLGHYFERWYPGVNITNEEDERLPDWKKAA